ncbi:hypothetical protein Cni_G26087 [Canna indica]|uniref:NPH3 domain-containing protein n=1 Tax=Canna indica TaxID=4628 RepID=A0AAQ3QQ47_9LILI|nr:hypothetical protein Cni_G26087 [Canna indica]
MKYHCQHSTELCENGNIIVSVQLNYAAWELDGIIACKEASESEQRELLETVITNLPLQKTSVAVVASSTTTTTTKFLFGLLRTVHILRASEAARAAFECKVTSQLELATLDDLLIPSISYLAETLYDMDCVERILSH